MNTPAHVAVNLLLLTRKTTGETSHARCAAIVAGALLPDLAMIGFYAWHLAQGTTEAQIWSVEYYRPIWQGWFNSFNSIPLIAFAMLVCWKSRRYLWLTFFSSMLLHVLGDLPVHHDDAHRHFFPFSDWRFASPVSYWNPAHYGRWFSLLEFSLVIGASLYLWRQDVVLRPWIATTAAVYLCYLGYVLVVWS